MNRRYLMDKIIELVEDKRGAICPTFVNVYMDADGRFLGDIEYDSYKLAYEGRDDLMTYVETVEIVRQVKKDGQINIYENRTRQQI